MTRSIRLLPALLSATLLLGACAADGQTQPGKQHYHHNQQNSQTARVYYGQILSLTPVKSSVKRQDPWVNAAGVVIDGLGRGRQNTGEVIGAVIGSLADQALNPERNPQEVEVLVLMEGSNEVLKVVQQNDVALKAGQRVRVVAGGGINRVLPLP